MTSDLIVVGITLIILLIVVGVITYTIGRRPPRNILVQCNTGQCATNIYTGEKRCPSPDMTVTYNPIFETCNSPFVCDSSRTPYAVRNDGGTNPLGICDPETVCRCLSRPQCGNVIQSLFTAVGGSAYTVDEPGSQVRFVQTALGDRGSNLTYDDPIREFCAIKAYHLNRTGCDFGLNPSLDEVRECLQDNPCVSGVAAFYPENPLRFVYNDNAIYSVPVACVQANRPLVGKTCNGDAVPVWDRTRNRLVCWEN